MADLDLQNLFLSLFFKKRSFKGVKIGRFNGWCVMVLQVFAWLRRSCLMADWREETLQYSLTCNFCCLGPVLEHERHFL